MRTDTIFYQLFQTLPQVLFELLGQSPDLAQVYDFTSQEIKELAFRFDGVFSPRVPNQPIYFVEVQFQPKSEFYWDLFTEVYLYLGQYRPVQDWQAVALFPTRKVDPGVPMQYRGAELSGQLVVIYLEDLLEAETGSIGLGILQVIMEGEEKAQVQAQQLIERIRVQDQANRARILELVERILIYKFSTLSREEIEAMFTMEDLKQTRYIQDLIKESEQQGKLEGKLETIPKLIEQGMSLDMISRILDLPLDQIEQAAQSGS